MVPIAERVAIIGFRFPGHNQMTPLANLIVGVSEHILAAVAHAAIHPEIPSMSFAGRIGHVWIALENNPAGPARAANPAVVHRALAALQVPHRPEPGFEGERRAGVRVVLRGPWQGRGCVSVSSVISGGTIVDSAGQGTGSGMPDLSGMRRNTAGAQIP